MALHELRCESDTSSERSPSPECQSWIEQTQQGTENDVRNQPWKKTFSNRVVNNGFDGGKDVITIKKAVQESDDRWNVQGNSLAA